MTESIKSEKLLLPSLLILAVFFLVAGGSVFLVQRQRMIEADQNFNESMDALQAPSDGSAGQETSKVPSTVRFEAGAILEVLRTQQQAWNAGDIDSFMRHYWQSDELTFSSGGKLTSGWQATLDGYKQRYSSREQMGTLKFSELDVASLGEEAALVLGRWQLIREMGDVGGNFSLVFRRIDGEWLIVHDHTSKSESQSQSGTQD